MNKFLNYTIMLLKSKIFGSFNISMYRYIYIYIYIFNGHFIPVYLAEFSLFSYNI